MSQTLYTASYDSDINTHIKIPLLAGIMMLYADVASGWYTVGVTIQQYSLQCLSKKTDELAQQVSSA